MSNQYTVVTRRSWLQRMGDSLTGILIGIALVIGAVALLWWNEGRSAWRIETLAAGRNAVISVQAGAIDPNNKGKLVHISGMAKAATPLTDPEFGVSVNALRLARDVQMYQWRERRESRTTKNLGGTETTETIYSYDKVWSAELIDSSTFHKPSYRNPASMPFDSKVQTAADITVGMFRLAAPFANQISGYEQLPFTDAFLARSSEGVREKLKRDGNLLVSGDPARPQIGDVKVVMRVVKSGPISAIGKQGDSSIEVFELPKGSIALLDMGEVGAEAMFANSESENRFLTWILRVVGFVLMWVGLTLTVSIVSTIADVVPVVGNIVGAATSFVMGLIAFALSLTVVGLAWLYYRPLIGLAILALAAAGFFLIGRVSGARQTVERRTAPS